MRKLKLLIFTLFFITTNILMSAPFPPNPADPPSVVWDPTSEKNMLIQIEHMANAVKYNKDMAENIGKGNFTPSVIGYLGNIYKQCGGKKYGLPDWFPKPSFQICTDEKKLVELSVDYYKENFLTLSYDTPEIAKKKEAQRRKDSVAIRAYALSQSVIDMEKAKTNTETIENLNNAVKSATTQMDIMKIQLQVQVLQLQQLQTLNERQALMIHIMGVKN